MSPLVSIIIPVFNVQQYLTRCLDSVINQTYQNVEIIIIDDGSTDDSFDICMNYQKEHGGITVIHQDNMGLSAARNRGISEARGEYLAFIDSDDFVSLEFVEMLVRTVEETKTALATTRGYIKFHDGEDSQVVFETCESVKDCIRVCGRDEFIKAMMLEKICTGAQFKLYRRDLFDVDRFPPGYYEDLALLYRLCAKQDKIAVLDKQLYAYRKRKNSIINAADNIEKKRVILTIAEEMGKYYEGFPQDVADAVKARSFIAIFGVFVQVPKENSALKKELWSHLLKYRSFRFCNTGNKKYIFEVILSCSGMMMSHFIGRLLKRVIS